MLNVIVNPVAGNGLAERNIKKVSKYLKKEKVAYLVYFTEKETDVAEFAQTLTASDEKDFVLIGGDGTIHQFINAVDDISKINIGIIPSGKNNNFANSLGLEFNPIKAISNIIENKIEKIDYLKINDMKACNYVSFGVLESAKHNIKRIGKKSKPNIFDYISAIKKSDAIEIGINGDDLKEKKLLICECYIANGAYIGSKMHASPLSNMQDGLCNIVCVSTKNKVLSHYLKIKKGSHIYDEENKTFWCPNFTVSTNPMPIFADVDGELVELKQLSVTVIDGGLNIIQSSK